MPNFSSAARRKDFRQLLNIDLGAPGTTGSTLSVQEQALDVHKTVLNLSALSVSMSDANVGGGTLLYTFPEGRIAILGAIANSLVPTTTTTLTSTINASKALSVGVGTVQTTTQASGTLATTEQNVIGQVAMTSSATINVAGTGANAKDSGTPLIVDGTATAATLYLNIGVPTATDIDGDGTLTFTGTIEVSWLQIGDY